MDNEILLAIIGVIATFVSGFTSWFFTRKKYNTEVNLGKLEALQKSLDFYIALSNDNTDRLKDVIESNKELRRKNEKLEDKNEKLEAQINKIQTEMFNLLGQICLNMQCSLRERGIPLFNTGGEQSPLNKKSTNKKDINLKNKTE